MHPVWRRCSSLKYGPIFSLVAPGQPGASPPSVLRRVYEMSSSHGNPAAPTWATGLTSVGPDKILIRGYPVDELMGRVSFADAIYLLLTGELPTAAITRLIDAVLVGFIDHGVAPPPTLAARHAASAGAR